MVAETVDTYSYQPTPKSVFNANHKTPKQKPRKVTGFKFTAFRQKVFGGKK